MLEWRASRTGRSISMSKNNYSALIAAIVAAVLMGVLGFFVRETHCSAQGCSFARFLIGMVLIVPLVFCRRAEGGARLPFSLPAVVSGAGISLCILFYFLAITQISVGIAALLLYTGPVFAAVGESLLRRSLPPRRDIMLMLASAAGIVLVTVCAGAPAADQVQEPMGYVYGLLSGVCYAAYILLNRQIPGHISLAVRTFWQFAAGSLVLLVPLLCTAEPYAGLSTGWPYLLCIGVLQGFAVLLLVAYAVRRLTAIEFGTISYLEPAVAVALGWLVYGESITPGQWCGFALVLGASALQSFLPTQK